MKKKNVAFFTPLSPIKSGIADHNEDLLPYLNEDLNITIVIDDNFVPSNKQITNSFKIIRHTEFTKINKEFDIIVYHIGNNIYSNYMYPYCKNYPGIIVLHDYNLFGLFWNMGMRRIQYAKRLWRNYGMLNFLKMLWKLRVSKKIDSSEFTFMYPINREFVESGIGIIVHSNYLKKLLLKKDWVKKEIKVVSLGVKPSPIIHKKDARKRLGIKEDIFLLSTVGFISPIKRIPVILKVFKEFNKINPNSKLALVGEISEYSGIKEIIPKFNLQNNLILAGYVPHETMYDYIAAADVCVNLRYPSAGETSGTLLRMFSMAKPVLISKYAQFDELPDDISFKIPLGENEEKVFLKYLEEIIHNPTIGFEKGKKAEKYIEDFFNCKTTANEYKKFINKLISSQRVLN